MMRVTSQWASPCSHALRAVVLFFMLFIGFAQVGYAQSSTAKNSRLLALLELGYGASWLQQRDSEYQESIWSTRLDFEQDLEVYAKVIAMGVITNVIVSLRRST